MKKIFVALLLSAIPFLLFAETMEKPMVVRTAIPEDYSVSFPNGAMRLDRMVFELELETGTDTLIEDNGIFTLPYLESGVNALNLSLLYYGNQSTEYSAIIKVDAGEGWVAKKGRQSIPMSIEFISSDNLGEGMEVREIGNGILELSVIPMGPRNGVEFANLLFVWSVGQDAWAGEYEAVVNISLEAV